MPLFCDFLSGFINKLQKTEPIGGIFLKTEPIGGIFWRFLALSCKVRGTNRGNNCQSTEPIGGIFWRFLTFFQIFWQSFWVFPRVFSSGNTPKCYRAGSSKNAKSENESKIEVKNIYTVNIHWTPPLRCSMNNDLYLLTLRFAPLQQIQMSVLYSLKSTKVSLSSKLTHVRYSSLTL